MATTTPISKVKLPNGSIYDFSTQHMVYIPDGSEYNVTWNITDFTGTVSLISGTTEDYLLSINEQRVM